MRLLILSDLHLEFADFKVPVPAAEFDAIVLAGDIAAPGKDMKRWVAALSSLSSDKPIVLVAGNHEFDYRRGRTRAICNPRRYPRHSRTLKACDLIQGW